MSQNHNDFSSEGIDSLSLDVTKNQITIPLEQTSQKVNLHRRIHQMVSKLNAFTKRFPFFFVYLCLSTQRVAHDLMGRDPNSKRKSKNYFNELFSDWDKQEEVQEHVSNMVYFYVFCTSLGYVNFFFVNMNILDIVYREFDILYK